MWWRGPIGWLLLGVAMASGCVPVTARQARLREAGWSPPATPQAEATVRELTAATSTLPDVPRLALSQALALVGAPRSDLDCSSLVVRAYAAAGVDLPRTVREQLQVGDPVASNDLQPGDLVFFAFSRRPADHVGIYAGAGQIVHVSSAAHSVQLAPLDASPFAAAWVAARRPQDPRRAVPSTGAASPGLLPRAGGAL